MRSRDVTVVIIKSESKEIVPDLPCGTVVRQVAGGGGGYGDPYQRSIEKVAHEVRNGILSSRKALSDYGVVIDPESLEVDLIETNRVRASRNMNNEVRK